MFDESVQEAVDVGSVSQRDEEQKVLTVVRKGFRYRGRLFRPEGVVVGRSIDCKEGDGDG